MYFPYFHSFITYFILAISRSNFAQIQWSCTFFNSKDDELFKNVKDFRIWVKFDQVIVKKTLGVFFFVHPLSVKKCKLRWTLFPFLWWFCYSLFWWTQEASCPDFWNYEDSFFYLVQNFLFILNNNFTIREG